MTTAAAAPPTVGDRYRAERARASMRRAAKAKQYEWEGELEQRVGHLGLRVRAPERRQRRPERFWCGHVSKRGGEYDWFYELNPAEQKRIRSNWFTSSRTAPSPSEIEEKVSMKQWLDMTRAIDMSKALQTGRYVKGERYGGMRPGSLIAGEPYEPAELHHRDGRRRAAHYKAAREAGRFGRPYPVNPKNVRRGLAYKSDGSLDVQFFTDDEGRVHPIRASYAEPNAPSGYVDEYDENF